MPFNGAYTSSQPPNDIASVIITDVSTGSDPNITNRQISLLKTDGSLLIPVVNWPPSGGSTITLTAILDKDYSLNVVVNWISSSPIGGSTYTQSKIITFSGYSNTFNYTLIQKMSSNPLLVTDNNFIYNQMKLIVFIDDSFQATVYGDQVSAQNALNRAKVLIDNANKYFS